MKYNIIIYLFYPLHCSLSFVPCSLFIIHCSLLIVNSCHKAYNTGTVNMVSTCKAIPPKDGIAIGTIISEPRPVEVRMGKSANIVVAVVIISVYPSEGSRAYWFVFISGLIAVSALMMPGVSGSFMLLILGMYSFIIPTFKSLLTDFETSNFMIILVFGLGLFTGLLSFSRVLSWTFKKYHQSTLMVLTGFIIGSLYKIWPWRVPTKWMNELTGTIDTDPTLLQSLEQHDFKVISEKLVLPGDYFIDDPKTLLVIGSVIFGFLLVWLLDRLFGHNKVKKV